MKKTLLCGVAFTMLAITPAAAQAQNAKPTDQLTQCGPDATNTYQVVGDGPPSIWRDVRYPEVGAPEYDPTYPVAICNNGIRQIPLKCVDQKGATADIEKCQSGGGNSAAEKWRVANQNLRLLQNYGNNTLYATEQKNLGSCPAGTYTWKSSAPDISGVCGTQDVPVTVTCIKVDTGENTWNPSLCDAATKPTGTKTITSTQGCGYDFTAGPWSEIPPSCGQVTQTREVKCVGPDGVEVPEAKCASYLTIGVDKYHSPQGVPVSEFWSQGMYPWPLGSPIASGNNILIYRMPSACNVGGPEEVHAECDMKYNTEGGGMQPYIFPKSSRIVTDARSCVADPTATYDEYHWNDPTYVVDKENVCGSNTKTGRVFCMKNEDGAEVDSTLCDPSKKPQTQITFQDESGCAPAPTPAPTPTPPPPEPEIVPVPAAGPPAQIQVGYCNYTSSGGGRYACGVRDNYRPGPAAPYPREMCTGTVVAGAEGDAVGEVLGTPRAGAGWATPPRLDNIAGARCVVHMRYGYSNDGNAGWQSVYFSGPPSGVPGGLFIGKKP